MDTILRPSCWAGAATALLDVQEIRLADGASVRLRAVCDDGGDDDALRRFFFTLSDATRYLYFCAGVPATATWAERFVLLAHTRGDHSYVLVAEVEDEVIGLAIFGPNPRTDPQVVDVGIILADAWQRRGLGGQMLCRIASEAVARGVTTLSFVVLWENRRMLRLARRIFPEARIGCASGSCDLSVALGSWRDEREMPLCG